METPTSPEQHRKPNLLRRMIQRLTHNNNSAIQPEIENSEPEKELRQLNIGTSFVKILEEKGVTIPMADRFSSVGVSALGRTNETIDTDLIKKVHTQKESPNGYVIGIGAGNVFRMLELFPEGQIPKAMILFDIDPYVVELGQRYIEQLKRTQSEEDVDIEPLRAIIHEPDKRKILAPIIKQLAQEGNLVIARADFTDPRLIDALNQLPDIHNQNNVIYLSNIADHVHRSDLEAGRQGKILDYTYLNVLSPQLPYRNFYVDTMQASLAYHLRIATSFPKLDKEDFGFYTSSLIQRKPTDEIEGPVENPLYEDMSTWDTQRLADTYSNLLTPRSQKRAQDIENSINNDRVKTLKKYEEWKEKAELPPEIEGIKYKHINEYVVPTDPQEETAVRKELLLPYDYERNFIPFLAIYVWEDKSTPQELTFSARTRADQLGVINIKRVDTSNYETFYTYDPRNQMIGKIEQIYLHRISYEELIMAKLYRELKNRVLSKNPNANTNGRSFDDLMNEFFS